MGVTEPCCKVDFQIRRGPVSMALGIQSVTLGQKVREEVSKEVMGEVRWMRKEVGTGRKQETDQGGMSQAWSCNRSQELSNSRSDKIWGGRGISRVTQDS